MFCQEDKNVDIKIHASSDPNFHLISSKKHYLFVLGIIFLEI